jgi:ABC-type phosphate transport system substrate-binding protein
MKKQIVSSLFLGAVIGTGAAWGGEVIGNISGSLTADEVREVFVGDKTSASGTKLVPMDNSAAQADFLAKVVKVDAAKYSNIWAKKGFRDGLNPPAIRGSDSEVVNAVKNTPGAIGYVNSAPAGVNVILKY